MNSGGHEFVIPFTTTGISFAWGTAFPGEKASSTPSVLDVRVIPTRKVSWLPGSGLNAPNALSSVLRVRFAALGSLAPAPPDHLRPQFAGARIEFQYDAHP